MNALAVTFGTSTRSKTFGIRQSTRGIDLSRGGAKNFLTFGTGRAARRVPKSKGELLTMRCE